ncbi:MAG: HlyC/CorC family transporter [Caldilineales bacterium]|nr:HlyC/CorC family transporter [Caldilineales bacterium]
MNWLIVSAIICLLIAINALFVAGEFATASARPSRLAQLGAEGNRTALLVGKIVASPTLLDRYIATCQLGITASSLVLGYYGQATLSGLLEPALAALFGRGDIAAESLSATAVLLFLTGLQVLFGELVPKNIGVRYPERLAGLTYYPVQWSTHLLRPLIFLFNGSAAVILRLFGHDMMTEHAHIHAPEELLVLVDESAAGGILDAEEQELLQKTLHLRQRTLRQVMIPRTRMLAAPVDTPCDDLFRLLSDSNFSRLPLYGESVDEIVGQVHLKDLLRLRWSDPDCADVRAIMHPPIFLPETLPAIEAFRQLQRQRRHLAVVLDEFGGVAGLVTVEDLIEELFGEIQDEFDAQLPAIEQRENSFIAPGDIPIAALNAQLGLQLPEETAATLGGLIMHGIARVPAPGDCLHLDNVTLRVEEMAGTRVAVVAIEMAPEEEAPA